MPDKTDTGGQPSLEKLMAEGVSNRKCVSYSGLGEYGGNSGGKSSGAKTAKQVPATSSFGPVRKGGY